MYQLSIFTTHWTYPMCHNTFVISDLAGMPRFMWLGLTRSWWQMCLSANCVAGRIGRRRLRETLWPLQPASLDLSLIAEH